jgi:hypothetical protein
VPLQVQAAWWPEARRAAADLVEDPRRAGWRGLAVGDGLLLLGAELPWAPGMTWLGAPASAPGLLLPTRLAPDVPEDLLFRAVRGRVEGALPVAVLPAEGWLVPAGEATPLDPVRLARWGRG